MQTFSMLSLRRCGLAALALVARAAFGAPVLAPIAIHPLAPECGAGIMALTWAAPDNIILGGLDGIHGYSLAGKQCRTLVPPGTDGIERVTNVVSSGPLFYAFALPTQQYAGDIDDTVDGDTRAPVPNVRVVAVPISDFGPALSMLRNDVNVASSDAEGHFRVPGLVAGSYALMLDAPQYARTLKSPVLVGDEKDLDVGVITLPPGKTVALHCAPVDACGAEARLLIGGRDSNWAAITAPLYNGETQLAPVPAGRFLLRLSANNAVLYEQDVQVADTSDVTDINIDLHKTAVSGMVIESGRPASGGAVVLRLDVPDKLITVSRSSDMGTAIQQNITPFARELVAAVDGSGRFALSDVAPGSYQAIYRRDAAVSAIQSIVVPPATTFTFTFAIDGVTIRGTVLDVTGAPIADAMVFLLRGGQNVVSAPTMYDGTFALLGVQAGEAVVRALRQKSGVEIPVSITQGMAPLRITILDHP